MGQVRSHYGSSPIPLWVESDPIMGQVRSHLWVKSDPIMGQVRSHLWVESDPIYGLSPIPSMGQARSHLWGLVFRLGNEPNPDMR